MAAMNLPPHLAGSQRPSGQMWPFHLVHRAPPLQAAPENSSSTPRVSALVKQRCPFPGLYFSDVKNRIATVVPKIMTGMRVTA